MTNTLDKIVTFFRVSPAQQVSALGMSTPLTVLTSYIAIENYSQGDINASIVYMLGAFANFGCFLANEYLAVKKIKEYDKVKSALDEHGWDKRIIEPKSHSWCQRNMVQVASDDSGFGKETRDYLHHRGYRWYYFG